jgi:hypothetical protein
MVPPASAPFFRRGQPATQRRVRWTQVDQQEHSANPETPASGEMTPVAGVAAGLGRERRGDGVRDVVTSRGAGWAVAAAMAGAVVGLSAAMATSFSPTVVMPDGAAGLRSTPAGAARAVVPGRALRTMAVAGRVRAQTPARLRIQASARVRLQVPVDGPLQVPARVRVQAPAGAPLRAQARIRIRVPAAGPLQAPAQLRILAAVPGPAGTLIPLPRGVQVLPGRQVIAGVTAPQAVRGRVRPGKVHVRLLVPAPRHLQVLPRSPAPRP